MKTTSANLPSYSGGVTNIYRECYYNTDSKAQGQWYHEQVSPDGVEQPWDITASYSDRDINLNVNTYDFGGFYISKTIDVGERIWSLDIDHIDYINIGEDLLISLGMTYEYHYQADPYYNSVGVLIYCSDDKGTGRKFVCEGGGELYELKDYISEYNIELGSVQIPNSHGSTYGDFLQYSSYPSDNYTGLMNYYLPQYWHSCFSDGTDIYINGEDGTLYKIRNIGQYPSNWTAEIVVSNRGIAGC
jgi:hypothetical protein